MTPVSLAPRELDTHWGMWDFKLQFNQILCHVVLLNKMAIFSSTCTHKSIISIHILLCIIWDTCQHTNSLTHTIKSATPLIVSPENLCWYSIYMTTSLKSGLYLLYLLCVLISKIWTHTCTHTGVPSLYTIFCTEASWNFKIAWCTHSNRSRNPLYVLCAHILASFPASPSPLLTFSLTRIAWIRGYTQDPVCVCISHADDDNWPAFIH